MQEKTLNKKENNIKNAEKYTLKYLNDLQHHFNLTDKQIITLMKNCIFKIKKTKKKHPPKKWWQIFQNTLLFKNIRIEKK